MITYELYMLRLHYTLLGFMVINSTTYPGGFYS